MIDFELIVRILPQLLQAAQVTLFLAASAALMGFFGGTLLGIAQSGSHKQLRIIVTVFVTIIRGTPLLLQITFFFLMLSQLGIHISVFSTAVLALGINSCAYISQIIRSGIASVSKGQIEAARSLGISSYDITRYIVLPQAVKTVTPALGNEFVTLIKETSLASMIGVVELYARGEILKSQVYHALTIYSVTGLIYLAMTTTLSLVMLYIEHSMNNHARN